MIKEVKNFCNIIRILKLKTHKAIRRLISIVIRVKRGITRINKKLIGLIKPVINIKTIIKLY